MAVPFLSGIDLNKTELLNAVLQNLATAPGTPVEGQFWYDTGANKFVVREGAANVSFALDSHDHDADYAASSHNHDGRYYTETEVNNLLAGKSDTSHTHDGRYYTETEVDSLLAGKSDTGHSHDTFTEAEHDARDHSTALGTAVLADLSNVSATAPGSGNALLWNGSAWAPGDVSSGSHNHDDRYYTETEVDTLLSGKSNTSHNHDAAYVNEGDHTKAVHDAMGIDAATVGGSTASSLLSRANHTGTQALSTITGHDKAAHDALNIDAGTLDGLDSTAFQLVSQKGSANGYAGLDGGGKVPSAQLPAIALTETFVVADIAARDALTVQEGDVAIVTGNSTSYIHDGTNWQELVSPTDGVQSVTGGTGITSSGGVNPSISITSGGVGTTQLANLAVTSGKLANSAVTATQLASNAVTSAKILDGNVTEAKLGFTRVKRVAGSIGDGSATSYTITHNLGTRDVVVMVYRNSTPYDVIFCDVEQTSTTQTTLRFAAAPATNAFRYVVVA